ncbi:MULTISPECIES: DUF4334 domain-containing protein [unclassified Rhodococcus (in: high G+C Gram-positive bacteria)]|uniref:DUF4334 domain-containing protein n=1 Tax=unclassified Rhodococcus (in: high G+C Gram-positive bacteria) TaxID=192944 RepID=UPI00146C5A5F|nr:MULTISPECIES: DUF4334 domain-containing protein [unclassified Rhodococcus (in: high G+C Gram-positive bacteria)]MBF0660935.1 DUF4334 domain-containing protein [Rhodococcus sp. (in: high G+C Gram-positive bacteria)]NMD97299.1 DUF4334 domain-containing protein [Rhodococcus sp. BL-253-APC-6A1W]NME80867.1 DUF4334 domain-containing protein [Rhodococcus sp. 105337]
MDVVRHVADLRARTETIDPRELDALWPRLTPARIDDLVGFRWKGFSFDTGHRTHGLLGASRWYGKTFVSPTEVQPLVCRGEDGELFSDKETGRGEASLWEIVFRGEVTATMVYDGMPVFDHFKKVDDDTLIGVMNGKGKLVFDGGEHYWFGLERDVAL